MELRGLLADAGLRPMAWQEPTDEGVAFLGSGPATAGPALLMSNARAKLANLLRNLEEERAVCAPLS